MQGHEQGRKNPYPEEIANTRIDDSQVGGERLATKWTENNLIVTVQKERAYFCYGFENENK